MGVSKNSGTGTLKWMVKIMANRQTLLKWMICGENPLFSETSIYIQVVVDCQGLCGWNQKWNPWRV